MEAAADQLWRAIGARCPDGPPPCAEIARRTGLADVTVSGAWAHGIGLDSTTFLAAARAMLTDVDDADHRLSHGTIDQRVAAVRRGLASAGACHLPEH